MNRVVYEFSRLQIQFVIILSSKVHKQKMDDTQSYLNQILKKRLGSVVNYDGSSKTANTVTRIPKQQQKIQTMPTVFRKKHQTVYIQGNNGSHHSQAQSEYLSMKQGSKYNTELLKNQNQMPEQNVQTSNQRVEYMLISKRIQNKKEDDYISPTVDVTKYSKIHRQQQQMAHIKMQKQLRERQYQPGQQKKGQLYPHKSEQVRQNSSQYSNRQKVPSSILQQVNSWGQQSITNSNQDYALGSHMNAKTDKSKRKNIFGSK